MINFRFWFFHWHWLFKRWIGAFQRINHYPADKHQGNQFHYPRERDLSTF